MIKGQIFGENVFVSRRGEGNHFPLSKNRLFFTLNPSFSDKIGELKTAAKTMS